MTEPQPFSRDTSPDVQRMLVACLRTMTTAEKARLVDSLTRDCEALALAGSGCVTRTRPPRSCACASARSGSAATSCSRSTAGTRERAVDSDGAKHALGLREGTTENAGVAKALLGELIERGLRTERPLLFVIDGAKALRKAIAETFGAAALVQRCQVHKLRNVLAHLPERMRASVAKAMHQAWSASDAKLARRQLERLAASLEVPHPSAAASIREGLEETLTLQRLEIREALYRTLRSTNAIENLNGGVASYTRNVKRWRGGRMILRWVGAALAEAQRGFRRVRGHDDLSKLVAALTRYASQVGQQKVA